MNRRIILASAVSSLLMLSACKEGANGNISDAFVTEGTTVMATVNDQPVTKQALDMVKDEFNKRSRQPMNVPDERWVDELVNRELLYQAAKNQSLFNDPEIRTKLALSARSILSDAYVTSYMKDFKLSDTEVQSEYQTAIEKMKATEYKARHILLKEEAEAKAVIVQLKAGADFQELAKSKSTGPSGPKGGDLGWFVPQQMVPEFSAAVAQLKDGEATSDPIKTRFGYHVILREGAREKAAPSLDSMKPQIEGMLKQKKLQAHIEELRNKANVVVTAPAAPEPAPEAAAATPATGQAPAPDAATQKAIAEAQASAIAAAKKAAADTAAKAAPAVK